jgi:hypothetical protein
MLPRFLLLPAKRAVATPESGHSGRFLAVILLVAAGAAIVGRCVRRGFGAAGVTVRTPQDMAAVEAWGADPVGVLVIDAKIASDGGSWWLAEAFRAHC